MAEATHHTPALEQVARAIAKRSFCMLATASPNGPPHVAGVLYQAIGLTLYTLIRDPLHAGGTVELAGQGVGDPR